MNNDRKLLEMAAKAAGLIPLPEGKELDYSKDGGLAFCGGGEYIEWNPLEDDGDALRLAVILRLDISPQIDNKVEVQNQWDSEETFRWAWVSYGDDAMAATRRAIVLTAAAIGKDMP